MRIDKFLKVSRLIKRRTIAKELAEAGVVSINGKKAKPSEEVKLGDVVTLRLGRREIQARVLSLSDKPAKEGTPPMFEVILERKNDD